MQMLTVGAMVGDRDGVVRVGSMEVRVGVKLGVPVWGQQGAGKVESCWWSRAGGVILGDVGLVRTMMVRKQLGCGGNCSGHAVSEGHSCDGQLTAAVSGVTF